VYGPLLVHDRRRAGVLQANQDFHRLAAELNRRGLRTVNGLQVFQETAAQEISAGELLFYREDNHWHPKGVERIARILADSVKQSAVARGQRQGRVVPGGTD
jgi:hypothetical protein